VHVPLHLWLSECHSVTGIVELFTGMEMQTRPTDSVAAVILDSTAAEIVTPLLHTQNIAQIVVPAEGFATQRIELSSESNKVSYVFKSLV
jgi:hypothetical protein